MTDRFSLSAQKILGLSLAISRELGHTYVGSEHFLLAFLCDKNSRYAKILIGAGADFEKTRELVIERTGKGERSADCVNEISPSARRILENASDLAKKDRENEVGADLLFSSLIREKGCSAHSLLSFQGCKVSELHSLCEGVFHAEYSESPKNAKKSRKGDEKLHTLQKYAQNISSITKSGEFDPLIGRDSEIERVIGILMRRTKNNPCLIGDPGVGKTAIVEELARRIAEGCVPDELCDVQIYSLDLPSMLAGAKYRGDFEERMKLVIEEVSKNPSVILFIDELHTLIGAGSAEGAIDAANIIKPALARSKIKIIGATTIEEYRRHIEKDAALERRFQSVSIREPSVEESIEILKGLRQKYEAHHGLTISDSAIEASVKLSYAYISDRFLPDKAIDLLDESAARVKINARYGSCAARDCQSVLRLALGEGADAFKSSVGTALLSPTEACVGENDVAKTLTEWTGIPVKKLGSDEQIHLINLEKSLKEKIIGQDEALRKVCSAIRRSKTGVRDPSRPLASFIFTGPSGVGKTSLAKALASELYGSEKALIRLDMSEYCEPNSISRLIGSPPGYIGYDDAGQLTERVRRNPHHIILFDELEKAHRDVFELLLQIMDEGELSDSHGRRVSFRNSVIIMTSNVGADLSVSGGRAGFISVGNTETDSLVKDKLKEVFSPEFLGRPDEIILFRELDRSSLLKICETMLIGLRKRLRESGTAFEFSGDVCKMIAESCGAHSGARDVRRSVSRLLETPLSLFLLSEGFEDSDVICAFIDEGRLRLVKEKCP